MEKCKEKGYLQDHSPHENGFQSAYGNVDLPYEQGHQPLCNREKDRAGGTSRITLIDQLWQDKNNCLPACIFMRYKVKSSEQN